MGAIRWDRRRNWVKRGVLQAFLATIGLQGDKNWVLTVGKKIKISVKKVNAIWEFLVHICHLGFSLF